MSWFMQATTCFLLCGLGLGMGSGIEGPSSSLSKPPTMHASERLELLGRSRRLGDSDTDPKSAGDSKTSKKSTFVCVFRDNICMANTSYVGRIAQKGDSTTKQMWKSYSNCANITKKNECENQADCTWKDAPNSATSFCTLSNSTKQRAEVDMYMASMGNCEESLRTKMAEIWKCALSGSTHCSDAPKCETWGSTCGTGCENTLMRSGNAPEFIRHVVCGPAACTNATLNKAIKTCDEIQTKGWEKGSSTNVQTACAKKSECVYQGSKCAANLLQAFDCSPDVRSLLGCWQECDATIACDWYPLAESCNIRRRPCKGASEPVKIFYRVLDDVHSCQKQVSESACSEVVSASETIRLQLGLLALVLGVWFG